MSDPAEVEGTVFDIDTFAVRALGLSSVALLPFNPAAGAKYEWLGMACPVQGEPQSAAELARLAGMARALGLEAVV